MVRFGSGAKAAQFYVGIFKNSKIGKIARYPKEAAEKIGRVWHGIPAILTVLGYAWVIKGFIYFVFPRHGLKVMARVRLERAWEFVVAGIVLVALGCLLLFSLISRGELS